MYNPELTQSLIPHTGILCSAFIRELSRHIGSDLRKLSRALDIDKTDFDAIEYRDPRDLKEQIVQFFRFWEEREGSKASVETLMAALKRAELFEVVDKMELFIKQGMVLYDSEMFYCAHIYCFDPQSQLSANVLYCFILAFTSRREGKGENSTASSYVM